MTRARWAVLWATVVFAAVGVSRGAEPGGALEGLRAGHPRVLVRADDLPRLRKLVAADPTAAAWHRSLRARADAMLDQKPVERVLTGPRLLFVSREALGRISVLAGLFLIDGDARYADRAKAELLAISAFGDWHPQHFLDVAEMTCAAALGYDWLYPVLTDAERKTVRDAIVDKGLKPGLAVYGGTGGWPRNKDNWNLVCNGGLTVGALAVADESPDVAGQLVDAARKSVPAALASYAPDGAWSEGPNYWNYASEYTAIYFAALDSALGTDFGLTRSPGFAEAGAFRVQTVGPTGLTFNFGDALPLAQPSHATFWLARKFAHPEWAAFERSLVGDAGNMFDLIWYDPPAAAPAARAVGDLSAGANAPVGVPATRAGADGSLGANPTGNVPAATPADGSAAYPGAGTPTRPADNVAARPAIAPGGTASAEALARDAVFRRVGVACMRGAWGNPRATFVGFKGGDNAAGHSHLDLGSFVLDADAQRWAVDLGPDDYNLPTYFGAKRFTYYRLRTEGHNTITLDGENQSARAKAPLTAFASAPDRAHAVVDLTAAYAPKAGRAARGVALLDRRDVLVQDELQLTAAADVTWNFHTRAAVTVDGTHAVLHQGEASLSATILSPEGAKFEVAPADAPLPQTQQPDVRNLKILLPKQTGDVRIAVLLAPMPQLETTPGPAKPPKPLPKIEPLNMWAPSSDSSGGENASTASAR